MSGLLLLLLLLLLLGVNANRLRISLVGDKQANKQTNEGFFLESNALSENLSWGLKGFTSFRGLGEVCGFSDLQV